jgi:hypothetical protein
MEGRNPLPHRASPIPEPRQQVKSRPSIRFSTNPLGVISMHLTAAHISPIVALIAGILILLMPRFLNFIVAIYLIFVGLAGLGLFKMFHL